jgi:hypothetical protein
VVPFFIEIGGRLRCHRDEQFRLSGQAAEALGEHADDGVGLAVQADRAAENRRIAAETVRPEDVTDDREPR